MENARLSPNRIPALPIGKKHWNYSEKPSVLALHKRIHRQHGPAKNYDCVDCGNSALGWSLITGREYSDNIEDYEPHCRKCHVIYDDKDNNRGELVSRGLKLAYKEGRRHASGNRS
jgi:hypothetical protein